MEKAQVIHIDDEKKWRNIVRYVIDSSNHEMVGQASTLDEAWEVMQRVEDGDIEADAIILDAQISCPADDTRGLAEKARDLGLRTIGLSNEPMYEHALTVDVDLRKENVHRLPDALDELE